jgi:signal transduction histidine kinase
MAKTSKILNNALMSNLSPESSFIKNIQTLTISELIEQYAYSEAIVETVREPLIILDSNLKVKSANKGFYETFKVKEKNTVGNFIYELGNGQWDIPGLRNLLEQILPKEVFFENFEVEHEFETIGKKLMLINARRIVLEGNKTKMILMAIEDVTENRMIEKRTEQFISMASHELRTPISSIMIFMQILETRLKGGMDKTTGKIMSKVLGELNDLNSLIKDLFEIRKIKEGVIKVKKRKLNLNNLIKEVVEDAKHVYKKNNIVFVNKSKYSVAGDKRRIKQVLNNLIDNAAKYSPKEGKIEIRIRRENGKALISVKDRGDGIPKKLRDQVFEPYRADWKKQKSGMGMGLYIVYNLVNLHKGEVWFDTKINKGTTMYFTLPLAKSKSNPAE